MWPAHRPLRRLGSGTRAQQEHDYVEVTLSRGPHQGGVVVLVLVLDINVHADRYKRLYETEVAVVRCDQERCLGVGDARLLQQGTPLLGREGFGNGFGNGLLDDGFDGFGSHGALGAAS